MLCSQGIQMTNCLDMCCAQKFDLLKSTRPVQRPACPQINTFGVFNYKNDFRSTQLGGSILSPKLRLWRFFLTYTDTYSSHECLEGRKILPEKGYHVCLFKQMYCVLRLSEPYRYSQTFLKFLLSQINKRSLQSVWTSVVSQSMVKSTICHRRKRKVKGTCSIKNKAF